MGYREQTVTRLREKLGREPTDAEIKVERDRQWKIQIGEMYITELSFRDQGTGDV